MDGGRAALLPRQGSEERAEAVQALQAGEERAPRRHRRRAGHGRPPAHRGLGAVRAVRTADDRPLLPVAGAPRLLPLLLPRRPRRRRRRITGRPPHTPHPAPETATPLPGAPATADSTARKTVRA